MALWNTAFPQGCSYGGELVPATGADFVAKNAAKKGATAPRFGAEKLCNAECLASGTNSMLLWSVRDLNPKIRL